MREWTQVSLCAAIYKALGRLGVGGMNNRQSNAVIRAADLIVEEFDKPHVPATPDMGLAAWLACDETGTSSRCMARVLGPLAGLSATGEGPLHKTDDHPLDPADFGRCLGLLAAAPELRQHLPAMAGVSPQWSALVWTWDELEALLAEELPTGSAPKCLARMQELLKESPT